ncbi:hypothetical protein WISP_58267 [Willisornis vidua]|uniref:Uncharacterized protein n=1 Tax=Willisornis vidua TaxID=1566151 RepID=A0ABQ9DBZ6_9PASS|nr:hypothetical protein WISP_58267 [Willisornis vidua]
MLCLMPPRTQWALLAARALMTHIQCALDQNPHVPFCGTVSREQMLPAVDIALKRGTATSEDKAKLDNERKLTEIVMETEELANKSNLII